MNGKQIHWLLKKILFVIPLLISQVAAGQKQLVILKRGEVVVRYNPGDDFVFTRKGSSEVIDTYVNNLSDTAVVTHRDTIPFHQIDRIYFRQHNLLQTIGTAFVIAGAPHRAVDGGDCLATGPVVNGSVDRGQPVVVVGRLRRGGGVRPGAAGASPGRGCPGSSAPQPSWTRPRCRASRGIRWPSGRAGAWSHRRVPRHRRSS